MEHNSNKIVDIHYLQTGKATATNELGMREMQAQAYLHRDKRFLLIKAPPASGKEYQSDEWRLFCRLDGYAILQSDRREE